MSHFTTLFSLFSKSVSVVPWQSIWNTVSTILLPLLIYLHETFKDWCPRRRSSTPQGVQSSYCYHLAVSSPPLYLSDVTSDYFRLGFCVWFDPLLVTNPLRRYCLWNTVNTRVHLQTCHLQSTSSESRLWSSQPRRLGSYCFCFNIYSLETPRNRPLPRMSDFDSNPFADPEFSNPFQVTFASYVSHSSISLGVISYL